MEEGSSQRLPTQGWVATEHDVTPSLEAAYNLPIIGKSGGVDGCHLSGESGSSYPAVRLCASSLVPPLCTGSVVCSSRAAGGPDRPDGAGTRCKLPKKSQVRSNVTTLSVLDQGQNKYESLSAVNRAKGTLVSNVQLKRTSPPTEYSFRARGGRNRGATSCPPSIARVFCPPEMVKPPQAGDVNSGNTARIVQHFRVKNRTHVEKLPTIFE